MFTDRVIVQIHAGKGGNGVIAWRREKYIPKGGPCGGNGGKGGSVILEADAGISSLEAYRNHRILKAENGQAGGSNQKQGKDGGNLILKVPCGTLVKHAKTHEILCDLTQDKQQFVICRGGKGGKGNTHFKSPTNRAPYQCTPGWEGEALEAELELKIIADVGLVGFPNAGKSTFLTQVTFVNAKAAPYPFTTLQPNLGFIGGGTSEQRILIADIPGIIEGAHQDKGLGLEFLRHIERTRLLLVVLDASGIDGRTPREDFKVLRKELKSYNPELLEKPMLIALNKVDTEEAHTHLKDFRRYYRGEASSLFEISAASGQGVTQLLECLKRRLNR